MRLESTRRPKTRKTPRALPSRKCEHVHARTANTPWYGWGESKHGKLSGGSVNVATTSVLSIWELVDQISQIMGILVEALVDVVEDRMGKDDAHLLDTTQLRAGLGWSGRVGLQEGLTVTPGWIEDNLSVLERLLLGYQHRP